MSRGEGGALSAMAREVVEVMDRAPRGPKRDGLFAAWLTLRVVEDLALEPPPAERAYQRRVALLQRRLSSLTLPPEFRRSLTRVLEALPEAERRDVGRLTGELMGAARELGE